MSIKQQTKLDFTEDCGKGGVGGERYPTPNGVIRGNKH